MSEKHTQEPVIPLRFLTITEVARLLRRSISWAYKQAESGKLPAIKLGGRLIFELDVIDDFISHHQQSAKSTTKKEAAHEANPGEAL